MQIKLNLMKLKPGSSQEADILQLPRPAWAVFGRDKK